MYNKADGKRYAHPTVSYPGSDALTKMGERKPEIQNESFGIFKAHSKTK